MDFIIMLVFQLTLRRFA